MDKKRVIRSAGIVSGLTSVSRLLGLVRDALMANAFGTSLVMSAFTLAFRIPNLFRRLFGEGALSAALVPVLVETREKEGVASAWELVNRVLSLLAVILTFITLGVILIAGSVPVESPRIIAVFDLLQIMMPYVIFICLAAVSMGILNSFYHFAISAFAPSVLNLLWIGALLFVVPHVGTSPEEKIKVVAWAVLLAGFLQWAIQWPVLRRFGWKPAFSREWRDEKVQRVMRLMGPGAFGMAITQVNVLVDSVLALWVSVEAPSALYYSERLVYLPLGIIATALGTVLLPVFSGHAAREKYGEIRVGLTDGLRHMLFVMVPASVGLLVLARPIIQMIFERGEFGAASTQLTALALQCYAPGLIVFSLFKVVVPAFYAQQDTKTPVKIGVLAVALNFILNITLILTLPQSVKHAGIAFATVLSGTFNVVCLILILQRRIGTPDWSQILSTALRSLGAAILMGGCVWFIYGLFPAGGKTGQVIAVLGSVTAGGGVYLLASFLFRAPEFREFIQAVRRK